MCICGFRPDSVFEGAGDGALVLLFSCNNQKEDGASLVALYPFNYTIPESDELVPHDSTGWFEYTSSENGQSQITYPFYGNVVAVATTDSSTGSTEPKYACSDELPEYLENGLSSHFTESSSSEDVRVAWTLRSCLTGNMTHQN